MAASKQLESILGRVTTATPATRTQPKPAAEEPKAAVVPLPAAEPAPAPEKPARKPAAKKPEPQKSVQAFVPASIDRALKIKAAQDGTTVRNIILQGLKAIGFDVPEDELRDKRGKASS
ncbi:hypothetical protein [Sinorhizobium saheli]|uniref:hypothetical protein n=1 Tax=Sinorhizobium saheli TaxID=36856 RepID=UPI001297907C|nr:hypothetical protein [Sinorhizobium saheli]MQW85975.1 hypothetical protein [Sinorhizobium saheli]